MTSKPSKSQPRKSSFIALAFLVLAPQFAFGDDSLLDRVKSEAFGGWEEIRAGYSEGTQFLASVVAERRVTNIDGVSQAYKRKEIEDCFDRIGAFLRKRSKVSTSSASRLRVLQRKETIQKNAAEVFEVTTLVNFDYVGRIKEDKDSASLYRYTPTSVSDSEKGTFVTPSFPALQVNKDDTIDSVLVEAAAFAADGRAFAFRMANATFADNQGADPLVKVSLQAVLRGKDGKYATQASQCKDAYVVLDPSRLWAVVEFHVEWLNAAGHTDWQSSRVVDYKESSGSYHPQSSRFVETMPALAEEHIVQTTYTDLSPSDFAEKEAYLSFYKIPEPHDTPAPEHLTWMLAILVCILLVAVVRKRMQR